jgi:hypothetical protein
MRIDSARVSRRTFLGALACFTPVLASADQCDGDQPSDALAVSPLDSWGWVETTSGRYLIGELIIRNHRRVPSQLIELRAGDGTTGKPAIRLEGGDLLSRLAGVTNNLPVESRMVAADDSALIFLWEPVTDARTIRSMTLEVESSGTSSGRETIVVPLATPVTDPVTVDPPVSGGPWVALYDPQMPRGHRRVAFSRGGRQVVPARFAIDWVRLDEAGRTSAAAADDFGRWFGFGADVLAVADGKVIAVRDGYPDVLTRERPAKWSEDDVSGNYVGLELASGRFAFYEHLQRGSVGVRVGETVRAGQPIARLGRSGVNSSGPHLHFHVGSDPFPLDSQGRPWVLSQFELVAVYPDIMSALSGTPWPSRRDPAVSGLVRNRMPATNSVVRFASGAGVV